MERTRTAMVAQAADVTGPSVEDNRAPSDTHGSLSINRRTISASH